MKANTQQVEVQTISSEDVMEALGFNDIDNELSKIKTVSGQIRYLTSLSWERKAIASKLGIRYQHVRNVQLQVLKKDGNK